jgi:1,4-alpha-glucan branching enzyme
MVFGGHPGDQAVRDAGRRSRLAQPLKWHSNEGHRAMTSVTQNGAIEFRFFRPNVREVNLAGDFNGWSRTCTAMEPDGEGWWRATLQLDAGDYRFRYYADGNWYTDYASNGIEKGKWGTNSVLVVPRIRMHDGSGARQVA